MTTSDVSYSGWDKGLDYLETEANLIQLITNTRNRRDKTYLCILLTQLFNGSRIGEAVDAMVKYGLNGKAEQRVRVEKRKDKKTRLMIVPPTVRRFTQVRLQMGVLMNEYTDPVMATIDYCKRHLGYNTHAQRYSWVTGGSNELNLLQKAALTGHKTLDHLLHYTNAVPAEKWLRERARVKK